MWKECEGNTILIMKVKCVREVCRCSRRLARETSIVLDPDRDFGVTDGGGYVGWGGLVDLYGLVGGGVVGGTGGHAEEILVCHVRSKVGEQELATTWLSWLQ